MTDRKTRTIRALILSLFLLGLFGTLGLLAFGCTQQQAAQAVSVGRALDAAYFARLQAKVEAMPAGPARDKAAAKLAASRSDADLMLLAAELGVSLIPSTAPSK